MSAKAFLPYGWEGGLAMALPKRLPSSLALHEITDLFYLCGMWSRIPKETPYICNVESSHSQHGGPVLNTL